MENIEVSTFKEENDLVKHYDENLNYSTPITLSVLDKTFYQLGLDPIGSSFLDLGCGNGMISYLLLNKYKASKVVGVDFSKKRIERAKSLFHGVQFICADVYKYAEFTDEKFDFIMLFEILEHLKRPDILLYLCKNRLNKGGKIICSLPIKMHYKTHLQNYNNIEDVENKLHVSYLFSISDKHSIFVI